VEVANLLFANVKNKYMEESKITPRNDGTEPIIQHKIMYFFGGRLELWATSASWRHPSEWVFSFEKCGLSGCWIFELGLFGITWNIGYCRNKE
jgi:hypothetical protein